MNSLENTTYYNSVNINNNEFILQISDQMVMAYFVNNDTKLCKYISKVVDMHNILQDIFSGMIKELLLTNSKLKHLTLPSGCKISVHITSSDIRLDTIEHFNKDICMIRDNIIYIVTLVKTTYDRVNQIYIDNEINFTDEQKDRMKEIEKFWELFQNCEALLIDFSKI